MLGENKIIRNKTKINERHIKFSHIKLHPFQPSVPFLYPLENARKPKIF